MNPKEWGECVHLSAGPWGLRASVWTIQPGEVTSPLAAPPPQPPQSSNQQVKMRCEHKSLNGLRFGTAVLLLFNKC